MVAGKGEREELNGCKKLELAKTGGEMAVDIVKYRMYAKKC